MSDKPSCSASCCCSQSAGPVVTVDSVNVVSHAFSVEDLDCADCAARLEKGLDRLKGVVEARINFATARLKVSYDTALLQPDDVIKAINSYGYRADLVPATYDLSGLNKIVLRVTGMDCADCTAKLEKKLSGLSGVRSATVNFAAGKLTVEHTGPESAIIQAVEQAGYKAEQEGTDRRDAVKATWRDNRRTQATIASGLLLAVATGLDLAGVNGDVIAAFYAVTAVIGGYHAAKVGFYGLRLLSFDMNFLMTAAIIGAAAIGQWGEGATVAFLFSLGNTLQTYTMDKTRRSIQALMELAPPEALVRREGREQKLPVAAIVVGDIIIVKPGERIAMDGIVLTGFSAVNQSAITGESLPVEKAADAAVFAGTVNGHGVLEVVVTKVAADSILAKIMHLVEEAQAQKAPSQQFVDVFAKFYTPAVLLAAAGIMTVPWLLFSEPFAPWFYKGLVLLVISCPCALVISTPVSIVAAIGNASRQGVLIKGGAYLEQLGSIQAIAFDKTGTLTHGRPEVTEVLPAAGLETNELLTIAASIERWSEHPLAHAVVTRAKGLVSKPVTNFKALVGRGAQADLEGRTVYIGNLRLFQELGHIITEYEATFTDFEGQGKTVMLVGTAENIFGIIAVADTLREDSKTAVQVLRTGGMRHVAMLTGDNRRVAETIAQNLELDAFYSDLLPEDKVSAVRQLVGRYGSVVMVGDGVNDAPALAAADIGVAMGVAGTDVALETADIALMADDLSKLAYVIQLSRKTVSVIKQNIGFAITVKLMFVALTFAGLANLWLAVFADMGASLIVTFNGMRLMRKLS